MTATLAGPNEWPAGSVAMVAMPLAALRSAARKRSYLLRVKPGPKIATGHPPAGAVPAGTMSVKATRRLPIGLGGCGVGAGLMTAAVLVLNRRTTELAKA